MSVKDKKKKEKKRQEALQKYGEDISKRPKGVSKREWIKAREQEKATGNLPTQIRARQAQAKRKQFISPLASNLSPQARQQADNIIQQLVPKSPFQTHTNASFAPRPQLSPQEKIKADSIIAQMGQSQFGNLNLSKPAPITYAPQEKEAPKQSFMQKIGSFIGKSPAIQSIQQKSLKPVGEALRNSFTPNESAKEGESTADYVARNMFQVAGLFGPSDLGTGAVSLSKEIAKSKSSDFIKSILKGKLKDETVERITPILTKSKDVKEIQGILKGAEASIPVVQKKAIADLVVGKPKETPIAQKGKQVTTYKETVKNTGNDDLKNVLDSLEKQGFRDDMVEIKKVMEKFKDGDEFSRLYKIASTKGKIFGSNTREARLVNELVDKGIDSYNFKKLGELDGKKLNDEFGKDFFDAYATPTAPKMTSKPPKVESDIPTPEVDDIAEYVKNKSTKFRVADEGDDLISQAKKMKSEGKSFDEFVEAQGTPVYHGTLKSDAKSINQSGFKTRKELGKETSFADDDLYGDVVFFTTDAKQAQRLGELMGTDRGVSTFQGANIEVIEVNVGNLKFAPKPKGGGTAKEFRQAIEKLKTQGFDGIIDGKTRVVWSKDKIKTKSQLLDIWNSELISGKKKAAKTPIEILQNEGNLSQTGIPKVLAKKTTQQEVRQSLRKDNITKNLSSGNVNDYSKAKKSIENTWRTAIREWGQDKLIRVKKLIDSGDIKVDDNSNPYLKESLMHGRISTRLDSIKHQITEIDKSISVNEKIFNDKALQKDIDRYLIAKHAPERNKALGEKAAGMTDNEASQILAELGTNPKRLKVIEEIGNKISTMNKQTLEILKDGGVIDDELFTTLTTKYKNHIPLNRIMDETDDIAEYLTGGRGINVKSTGIKRAKGSEREVSDILTNVTANLEQAVVRSEKNRVAQSVLKLARDNKMVGGLFEEIKPRAIGESFDGKPLLERINDPLVMTIRENGKPVYLKINDKNLAEALQGVNIEQLGTTMRTIGWFTRMYSGLMTRFNPEFAFSNVIRDMQENMVYASSKEKMGITGALKIPTKTVGSTKNIVDFMRGKKTAGSNLYKQMLEDGGSTGGMSISTKKQLELDINKIRKLNRSNPRKAAEMVINGIDNWNQIFEDANRLSAYKVALDRGYSREMAASIAKESTINFNRKGTAGSFINSLYMFSNASIQGSTKMLQALKNPKTAVATATAVGIPVVLANQWNDSVDPQWRDKVSEWDRQSNLVVMLPSKNGDANYVTIPVGWGIKPIMATVNSFYDISQGTGKGLAKEGGKILTSIIEGYNPAGGTDLISAITPTPLDTPSEIARNKSWSGSMIRPDWKEGLPKTEQNFDSLKDKATGRVAINTAEFIRDKTGVELNPQAMVYALEAYIGGAGKTVTKTGNFLTSLFKGEDLAPQETPVVSRFYKEKPAEELQTRAERNAKNEFFKSLKKYETGSDEQKKVIQEYVISKPEEERQGLLFQIRDLGFDTKGITSSTDAYNIKPTYEKINKLFESGKTSEAYKEIDKLSASDKEAFNRMKSEKKPSWYKPKEVKENPQKQTFEKAYELQLQGKYKEADDLVKNMTDEEFEDYKKARTAKRASNSATMKARLAEDPKLAVEFVRSQPKKEQERLINLLTDEQYERYQEGK